MSIIHSCLRLALPFTKSLIGYLVTNLYLCCLSILFQIFTSAAVNPVTTSLTLSSLTAILTHCFYWQVLLDIVWNWGDIKFGWLRHSLQTNPYPCLQNKFYWNHLLQIYLLVRIYLPVLLHWLRSTPKLWNLISLPVGDVCVCIYIYVCVCVRVYILHIDMSVLLIKFGNQNSACEINFKIIGYISACYILCSHKAFIYFRNVKG